jgi:acyl-CoA reductase-like NAD-dependent aldehyde dehydrogenase
MKEYKMLINGKWVGAASGKTYTVLNPATEEPIAKAALGGSEDVNMAVEAAQKAYPIWSKKSTEERSRILKEIAEIIRKRSQELVDMDILDHGSPVGLANMFGRMIGGLFGEMADLSKILMTSGDISIYPGVIPYMKREPIGVVACIVPWNVPLMIAMKIAASLATGNTCVAKPPSVDSLGALQIADMMSQHPDLPAGAVNVITGPGNTVGEALSAHPGVGMISFTGSCETGKAIMSAASKTVKRLFLELGGKNPFIVLADADLEQTVAGGVDSLLFNTGMICGSPGRFYVHEKLHDKFVEKFVDLAKKYVVGDPNDPKTQLGPVVSAEHRDRVERYIKIGVEEGAELVLGGKRPTEPPLNKGYYIKPTDFTNITQQMTLAREEVFGPVACIMKYSSEDEVLDLANDNTFGLAASVWTTDFEKAMRFVNGLQAGCVSVNTHNPGPGIGRGGFKESGFGKEAGGLIGLQEYTQQKGITVNLLKPGKATK